MSTQITLKTTTDTAAPAAQASAVTLRDARWPLEAPSHGQPASPAVEPPRGLVDLGPAAALKVRGPDRENWLQGMMSADVRGAAYGSAVYAAFLGGKGRLVCDGLVFRAPDELTLAMPPDRLAALQAHLDGLLIMEDAELTAAEGLHRLRFCPGVDVPDALDAAGAWQPLGLELLLPEADAQRLIDGLPRLHDLAHLEQYRVALGVPAWGRDLDEETTPIEAGLDRALSFGKGCYVGQEVVAMATYRGRVAWNLVRLLVEGAPPPLGSAIDPQRGGKRGRVTSAVPLPGAAASALLGYVHKELITPGTKVPLEDGRQATVLGLPYGARPGAGVCA